MYFHCYYCDFETAIDRTYQNHVIENHPEKPFYPSLKQIQKLGLKPQNKVWEEFNFENP
jgi:hypothetical protein